MTKIREPLTYNATLDQVGALIGWDNVAAICGVSLRTVRNWSEPDTQAEIRMIDAERLDRACLDAGADHAPFHTLFALRLELSHRNVDAADLIRKAGKVAKEGGEAANALLEAAANPRDRDKRRTALREAQEAVEALTDGIAALGEE